MNVSRQPFIVSALLALALGAMCVAGRASGQSVWTWVVSGAAAVVALGLLVQLSIRMSPGGASRNYLPIQVFVTAACAAGVPTLTGLAAALFVVAAMRRAAMAAGKQVRMENVFRAGLFFGLAAMVYPPAAGVAAVMMPAALLIYKRSAREWIVGVVGLGLPFALAAFVWWALPSTGVVPRMFWTEIVTASNWLAEIDLKTAMVGGAVVVLGLTATVCGLGGRTGARSGPRRFMAAVAALFVSTLALAAVPGSGPDALPIVGVGAACAVPYGFWGRGATATSAGWFLMVAAVVVAFFM